MCIYILFFNCVVTNKEIKVSKKTINIIIIIIIIINNNNNPLVASKYLVDIQRVA